MQLGTRSIRSAGAGSGSIEVTLPGTLRVLTGIRCRIALRDGLRPEIVLQPEFGEAQLAFARIWDLLAATLGIEGTEAFTLADIALSLHPLPAGPTARLAWADGLVLAQPAPHAAEPLARTVRGLGALVAARLGIAPGQATGFAACAAQALTGLVVEAADQSACDMAAHALAGASALRPDLDDAFDPRRWSRAAPSLRRIAELHQDWSADPARHAVLHAAWRRGVTLELSGD